MLSEDFHSYLTSVPHYLWAVHSVLSRNLHFQILGKFWDPHVSIFPDSQPEFLRSGKYSLSPTPEHCLIHWFQPGQLLPKKHLEHYFHSQSFSERLSSIWACPAPHPIEIATWTGAPFRAKLPKTAGKWTLRRQGTDKNQTGIHMTLGGKHTLFW